MNKIVLYYTCNTHSKTLELTCREYLLQADLPIVAVALNEEIYFGNHEITVMGKPSILTMHTQIVAGLKTIAWNKLADVVFLCENDVLYHPSHFDFEPADPDTFYYNTNVYKCWQDGHKVWTDNLQQISGLCVSVDTALKFFAERLWQIEVEGDNRHYEPNARYGCNTANWQSTLPNVDIRHNRNLTRSHRTADEFRNKQYAQGFKVVDSIPYWDEQERLAWLTAI